MFSTHFSPPVLSPGWQQSNHSRPGQIGSGSLQNKGGKTTSENGKEKMLSTYWFFPPPVSSWRLSRRSESRRAGTWLTLSSERKKVRRPEANSHFAFAILDTPTSSVCFFFSGCSCVRGQHRIWKVCTHDHSERATGVSILSINNSLLWECGWIQGQHVPLYDCM